MIVTLTLNPCIDKTVSVPSFSVDKMNRVRIVRTDPSGKGINVSIALSNLGMETACVGFNFTNGGALLEASLTEQGIPHRFVTVEGRLRTNLKVFDEAARHTIEINEYGDKVEESDIARLTDLLLEIVGEKDVAVLSGSIPAGVPKSIYGDLCRKLREARPSCRLIVDGEGELLVKGLEESPFAIKPNIHELESTLNCKIESEQQLVKVSRSLIEQYGVKVVCPSMGPKGAAIVTADEAWFCDAPDVEIKGIPGAGDSMVAGLCLAVSGGKPVSEMLRYAVAAAGASISMEGTLLCTKEGFEKLLPCVNPRRISE
jgi:1-phosphofructokinase